MTPIHGTKAARDIHQDLLYFPFETRIGQHSTSSAGFHLFHPFNPFNTFLNAKKKGY
jgi:hypothetical protein